MLNKNTNPEVINNRSADYYDMTEKSAKRSGSTQQSDQSESDDVKEKTTLCAVSSPSGDSWAENKISTTLDEEQ